jgi:hypothetical protein
MHCFWILIFIPKTINIFQSQKLRGKRTLLDPRLLDRYRFFPLHFLRKRPQLITNIMITILIMTNILINSGRHHLSTTHYVTKIRPTWSRWPPNQYGTSQVTGGQNRFYFRSHFDKLLIIGPSPPSKEVNYRAHYKTTNFLPASEALRVYFLLCCSSSSCCSCCC